MPDVLCSLGFLAFVLHNQTLVIFPASSKGYGVAFAKVHKDFFDGFVAGFFLNHSFKFLDFFFGHLFRYLIRHAVYLLVVVLLVCWVICFCLWSVVMSIDQSKCSNSIVMLCLSSVLWSDLGWL